ncbi:MAG TPA: zinc-binding dehydrogenase [Aggregatilineales bacterium]|nr:zinc-binding dehydrogenase [Anaerolineales bacterium]HRE49361.1 zinc-binding dehydrogenase [Aggregatilineales bacterium]
MRAVIIQAHGGVDQLRYIEDFPTPTPQAGEVRVRVRAAALNRLDIWVRNGWEGIKLTLPHILGADAAGEIDALGGGVKGIAVGDRVVINPGITLEGYDPLWEGRENLAPEFRILGEDMSGTYCEYVCVPARNVLKLPDHVGYNESAAAALVFLTAWHSLITRGGLRAGESVLIVGAGGGVNSASIPIAKYAGATVYVVGSSAAKLEEAAALGADHLIDRSLDPDWARAVYKLTGRAGVDVVVDNVGKDTYFQSIRAVKRGGRILTVGNTSGALMELDLRYVFSKQISLIGSTMAPRRDFITVMNLIFAGKLTPKVGAVYPLAEAAAAHIALERGDVFGKIVLTV